jgi:cytochrome c oxidase subunit IV
MNDTHAHDDAHGGGHHILERDVLIRTFSGLVALTLLTVGLALAERAGLIPLGGLSVPVALAIAGAKATLVAAFFMGLKNDGGTNLLAFVGGVVFLGIFLIFTYLDTGYRDTFEAQSAVPIDILEAEERALLERQEQIAPLQEAQPLIVAPDTLLFPNAQVEPAP